MYCEKNVLKWANSVYVFIIAGSLGMSLTPPGWFNSSLKKTISQNCLFLDG